MGKGKKFGGRYGGGAMPGSTNMLLKQAAKVQQKMAENKERFNKLLFTGEAGGALKIVVRGDNTVMDVKLDEVMFKDMEHDDVEDLIKSALTDVLNKIKNAENDAERALVAGATEDMSNMSTESLQEIANIVNKKDE